jgi:spectinomycin phosphotransferase/16S rRNA (guanine(1405)-N(7))-methyltransferase
VHTPPADLPEPALSGALRAGWSLTAATLTYRPVGFGSHHWHLTTTSGTHHFVTVDDLRTRRTTAGEPLAAPRRRLRASLSAAQALRAAGRDFVVAPLPAHDGEPFVPVGEHFTASVYPLVDGEHFSWGTFTPEHRWALLDLLLSVHSAPPAARARALPDDHAIPFRATLTAAVSPGSPSAAREPGPYAEPAARLLASRAAEVRRALAHYDALVAAARADPAAAVLTHGEPHPGNTMRVAPTSGSHDGWLLIDWDTVLLAPPERDLWDLDPGDGTLHAAYAEATGTRLRPELMDLYRLRWDLTDLSLGVARFRDPHGDTDDDRETWEIVQELAGKDLLGGLTRTAG